jgi:hypothetical protein
VASSTARFDLPAQAGASHPCACFKRHPSASGASRISQVKIQTDTRHLHRSAAFMAAISTLTGCAFCLRYEKMEAVNARYRFTPINQSQGATVIWSSGYLPIILAKETFIMPVAHNALPSLQYELVFTYESLSGKHYESRIRIDNLVLTDFRFARLGRLHARREI